MRIADRRPCGLAGGATAHGQEQRGHGRREFGGERRLSSWKPLFSKFRRCQRRAHRASRDARLSTGYERVAAGGRRPLTASKLPTFMLPVRSPAWRARKSGGPAPSADSEIRRRKPGDACRAAGGERFFP
jgi:hypothetical protein